MFNIKSKMEMFPIITGFFCGCLLISNILSSKTFCIGNIILPCAVVIFPIVYIVNNVLTEIYGFKLVKRVIYLGFVINLIAVIVYQIIMLLPSTDPATGNAFAIVLSSTPRILIASFISYLVGSYVNAYLMKVFKSKYSKYLFTRCSVSTLFGEGLDTIFFISIAFAGTMPTNLLIIMIICQGAFKILYEIIIYPVTRYVIHWMRSLDDDIPFSN